MLNRVSWSIDELKASNSVVPVVVLIDNWFNSPLEDVREN